MSYSTFTLGEVVRRFGLTVNDTNDLFSDVPPRFPSARLSQDLAEYAPLAVAMRTEKARSELLIAPILLEMRRQANGQISLFSGEEFNVNADEGLNGVCDFLVTRSPRTTFVEAPVLAIVEAKREDPSAGLGQCAASMIAAHRFNERDGRTLPAVYGAVTTGDVWKFLILRQSGLAVDQATYYLDQIAQILGILLHMTQAPITPNSGSVTEATV